jgi:hypothetical protein
MIIEEPMELKKCPKCGKEGLIFVEYDYSNPEHYDGISEIYCVPCRLRIGRWTGKELKDGEFEKAYGIGRQPVPMAQKEYYTAPPLKIFKEIKEAATKIWNTYDDDYGYRTEKLNQIKDLENVEDNAWFIVAMFDPVNQQKLINLVSEKAAELIRKARGW